MIIPALDILQSVPVLGFLTFTVTFFLQLFPGSVLGAECAAIFAIFTSQAWNMAFSFYQSLRTVPRDLDEVARHFRFSPWLRFWRLDVPFGAPGLIWNTMMSMSGGWFFVVASEAITVGNTTVMLPGIGSWLALAIEARDLQRGAAGHRRDGGRSSWPTTSCMFRPIVAWADKFRFEQQAARFASRSRGSTISGAAAGSAARWCRAVGSLAARICAAADAAHQRAGPAAVRHAVARPASRMWIAVLLGAGGLRAAGTSCCTRRATTGLRRRAHRPSSAASLTLMRVAGADRAGQPRLGADRRVDRPAAAARHAPAAGRAVPRGVPGQRAVPRGRRGDRAACKLDPNIWLSPLMVLGTQWYILFNVIAGASAFPTDLRDAAALFRICALVMVAQGRRAGDPALLRDRRAHRVGRLVERQHRRRGGELG